MQLFSLLAFFSTQINMHHYIHSYTTHTDQNVHNTVATDYTGLLMQALQLASSKHFLKTLTQQTSAKSESTERPHSQVDSLVVRATSALSGLLCLVIGSAIQTEVVHHSLHHPTKSEHSSAQAGLGQSS